MRCLGLYPSPSTSPSLTFLLKISGCPNPRSIAAGRPWGFGGRRPRSSACSGHPSWTANDGMPAWPLSGGDESGCGLLRVGRWGEQAGAGPPDSSALRSPLSHTCQSQVTCILQLPTEGRARLTGSKRSHPPVSQGGLGKAGLHQGGYGCRVLPTADPRLPAQPALGPASALP